MKKNIILLFILLGVCFEAFNQINPFIKSEIVWYGIDFSAARLIGAEGFTNPQDIRNSKFDSWNQLILNESDKYNVKKFFKKNIVHYDITLVHERNAQVNPDDLVISEPYSHSLDKAYISKMIESYNPEETSGVGLVFIVESFNKPKVRAYIYVTFFDIATKQVLFTEKVKGEPGGFSMRNYWAGAILNVMENSKSKLKEWSKNFEKK